MRDAWLTRVLGYEVFKADGHPLTPFRSLTYSKVPVEDVAEAGRLQDQGFRVVDVNVLLQHYGRFPQQADPAVGVFQPEDEDAVLDIAGSCFRYSRFHQDPNVGLEDAHRIKREWIRNYIIGDRGIELLIAKRDGEVAGFLAVLDTDNAAITIDLIGVDERFQRQGVATSLVRTFLWRHQEAPRLIVGTQAANIPSLNLYQRCGFQTIGASYVLHLHRGVRQPAYQRVSALAC